MRILIVLLLASAAAPLSPPRASPSPTPAYFTKLEGLDTKRRALGARFAAAPAARRAALVTSARQLAFSAITADILPAWYGTPWDFYGTTETPGEGTIACGYFVSTVLRDAGLKIERGPLARQASEKIVKTLAPAASILRFRNAEPADVVAAVKSAQGDGLYVVGMDYHVAFLVIDGTRADLCHSAVLPPRSVVCEPAVTSPGFQSRYYVVGPALPDARIEDWLAGKEIPTSR